MKEENGNLFCTGPYLCNPETDWRYHLVLAMGTAPILGAYGTRRGRAAAGSRCSLRPLSPASARKYHLN